MKEESIWPRCEKWHGRTHPRDASLKVYTLRWASVSPTSLWELLWRQPFGMVVAPTPTFAISATNVGGRTSELMGRIQLRRERVEDYGVGLGEGKRVRGRWLGGGEGEHGHETPRSRHVTSWARSFWVDFGPRQFKRFDGPRRVWRVVDASVRGSSDLERTW